MFDSIPSGMAARMAELEKIDAADRVDGTERMKRLRQVPLDIGRLIAMLAATAPEGRYVEIGTSAGYSTMWLSLACRELGRTITTFEVLPVKIALARETFRQAGIEDIVELVHADAREHLPQFENIGFCFLDAEKEVYLDCYELLVPRMVRGGLIVADNAVNHAETLAPFLDRAQADPRVDAMILPFDNGELIARKR
jgi:caffeoyl-CoA O-methyltransferase